MKTELPEKKIKTEENTSKVPENSNEESKKPSEPAKSQTAIDEEDEDMRLYRLKIEEQKREREKVLRMKEERRKLMLQQQQQAEEEKSAAADNRQQGATSFAQKNNFPCNNVPVSSVQAQYFGKPQSSADDELASLTFKVPNNLQILQKPAPTAANVQKPEPTSNSFMSNRVVVVKGSNNQKGGALQNSNIVKTVEASHDSADVGQGLSSFFNNRKVLKKDNSLINTRLVIINNLSASTNQNKLVAMTRGIGEIQKLRMDKQERQATILFKSVASAHAFFKKYQRHMLDLSVIDVKLEPML
ncbi:hypothetical protein BDFB_001622 [Asbolus verrucosus]|uniref:Uncharacterized protein n=1 Tax=Asbolus verrucosus TaxID=1661398 RepID=A0A482VTD6_ASBVE|nr:hypothetical protein BDFB_001622 [Asbolus verrucosus]